MKRALVTGATSGVGRALVETLRNEGYLVHALGRNKAALDELGRLDNVMPLGVDLADTGAVAEALAGVEVDVLINNAGLMPPPGPFQDIDPAEIAKAVSVNVTAQLALTRLVVPGMCKRGSGHVFFTGSISGHAPYANMAVYCATKAAVGGFAQALRLDLADYGVRVTEIVAGRIETALYTDVLSAEARAGMYRPGTTLQPEDVARMTMAVLAMPEHVDVSRFDILPARITPAKEANT
ncbi:SDR family oxidoreductase [Alloyangia pacifica]|uniref:NADP-dependent 3-hydroxy acid dehydrogenase YdfG n=1 Tax=Alloyangia pacifica TaxID=311180 RepID=A0A1I6UQ37_9RHOB|nr:SDR family oxidoreductase [Alloyangia pacifica]SDH77994.1 NADP-dependent 3-hydroxy acid dehydrogenase YdfG [Alloyangia pacifica]SFT03565.1 NADP-dependent 3-hydroxy acid dehydrogenase YdfG [Alloyangia pacifica]